MKTTLKWFLALWLEAIAMCDQSGKNPFLVSNQQANKFLGICLPAKLNAILAVLEGARARTGLCYVWM